MSAPYPIEAICDACAYESYPSDPPPVGGAKHGSICKATGEAVIRLVLDGALYDVCAPHARKALTPDPPPAVPSCGSGRGCGNEPSDSFHPCPFRADVDDDPSPCCTCCPDCVAECCDDI